MSFKSPEYAPIVKRWGKWVANVKNEDRRNTLAVLLENQFNYTKNRSGVLTEAGVGQADAGVFQKVILPVVRRVYPRLIAPEIVGVQPMTGPHGVAVFLRYYYENQDQILEPQGNADGRRVRFREYESAQYLGNDGVGLVASIAAAAPTDTLTLNFTSTAGHTVEPAGVSWNSWVGGGMAKVRVQINDVVTPATLTGYITIVNTHAYPNTGSGGTTANIPGWVAQVDGDLTLVTTAPAAAGEIQITATPATYLSTALTFTIDMGVGAGGSSAVLTQPFPGTAADFADAIFTNCAFLDTTGCPIVATRGLESTTPALLRVKYETHPITAQTYKLNASWSIEANQDVSALHGESLEDLLSNLLTQELLNETDFIVVNDLLNIAGYTMYWNRFPGVQTTTVTGATGNLTMPAFRGTTREHWETFAFAMNDLANSIHTRILRGPANFAVVSPDVATIVESYPEFKAHMTTELDSEVGIVSTGALSAKYKIFKDARLPKGTCLMGYKGKTMQDTGYVMAPYIPATLGPVVVEPGTYDQMRLIMTRFGKTTLMDGSFFYGKILVTENNLATSDWTVV